MQKNTPFNQLDLSMQIDLLKAQKKVQQADLANSFHQFVFALNPVTILKNSINNLVADTEVTHSLANAGAQMGTNLVIDMVLGKYRSVKGFFGSVLLEKVIQPYVRQFVANQFVKRR